MRTSVVQIGNRLRKMSATLLSSVGQMIHDGLSANAASFPTPSPSLANLQTAIDNLANANLAFGTKGNLGSHSSKITRDEARSELTTALISEAAYVLNIARTADLPVSQAATVLLAAMRVKNNFRKQLATQLNDKATTPTLVCDAPRNLREIPKGNLPDAVHGAIYLRWKKPIGTNAKAEFYQIRQENQTTKVSSIVMETTKCSAVLIGTSADGVDEIWLTVHGVAGGQLGARSRPVSKFKTY